jgi:two-component system response regulator HupR/HoxA
MKKNIILFVDDEINSLNSIRRAIIDEKFIPLFANSAQEALEMMRRNNVSVLVTDMQMPGMDGLTLLKEAKLNYPDTIRIVVSGYTQLSNVLTTVNQGDIFRFIAKPWNKEDDLLPVLWQAMEYYNLRQDKKRLELSLHERNSAYKKMLRTMEKQFSSQKGDTMNIKNLLLTVMNFLESEIVSADNKIEGMSSPNLLQIQVLKEITADYLNTIPTTLEEFSLEDIIQHLHKHLADQNGIMQCKLEMTAKNVKCCGNYKLLAMILLSIFKLIRRSGTNRSFSCITSSETYKGFIRVNNIIEIGYVDGGNVLIDANQLLTHTKLDNYSTLLTQIGKAYNISVTYTYINQNSSIITVTSDFPHVN